MLVLEELAASALAVEAGAANGSARGFQRRSLEPFLHGKQLKIPASPLVTALTLLTVASCATAAILPVNRCEFLETVLRIVFKTSDTMSPTSTCF